MRLKALESIYLQNFLNSKNLNMRVSNVLGLFKAQKTSEAYNLFAKQGPILKDILEHEGTPQEIAQGNSCFLYW
jgi:hypothetical protein